MPFLWVGVGGRSELVVPTYYVGRQAHLCESRRVLQKIAARSMKKPFRLFLHQIWKTQQIKLRMEHMAQPRFQPIDILPGQDSGIAIRPFRGFPT